MILNCKGTKAHMHPQLYKAFIYSAFIQLEHNHTRASRFNNDFSLSLLFSSLFV